MTWNYRVMRRLTTTEEVFEIHEVYYDDDHNVTGWTLDAIAPHGDTPAEVRTDLELMLQALDRPSLDL